MFAKIHKECLAAAKNISPDNHRLLLFLGGVLSRRRAVICYCITAHAQLKPSVTLKVKTFCDEVNKVKTG